MAEPPNEHEDNADQALVLGFDLGKEAVLLAIVDEIVALHGAGHRMTIKRRALDIINRAPRHELKPGYERETVSAAIVMIGRCTGHDPSGVGGAH